MFKGYFKNIFKALACIIIAVLMTGLISCKFRHSDGNLDSAPTPSPSNFLGDWSFESNDTLSKLKGAKSGVLYYNLNQFGISIEMLEREDSMEESLLALYLKCSNFSVTGIDTENLTASITITSPALDSLIISIFDEISKESNKSPATLLDSALNMLSDIMPQETFRINTSYELKIIPDGEDKYRFNDSSLYSDFIDVFFTRMYSHYVNEEYLLSINPSSSYSQYGIANTAEIENQIIDLKVSSADKTHIFIAEHSIDVAHNYDKHSTEAFRLDLNSDGSDEVIWIDSEYGLIIFEEDEPCAVNMPDEWRRRINESVNNSDFFDIMLPIHLMVIDSDIHDNCIEIIVCMKNAQSAIVEGEYYVFTYEQDKGLRSKNLLAFGQAQPYLGMTCKGNHLAIETLVNIMGFRYMQLNARLNPKTLELDYYTNAELFFKHTIQPIAHTGIPAFTQSNAVLATALECYYVDDTGNPTEKVCLAAGTTLTPVRASCALSLTSGGLSYDSPIFVSEYDHDNVYPSEEDYIKRFRKGKIMFRDDIGDAYMVEVEITPNPAIKLCETNVGENFRDNFYYPESIYIGGIEQNVLFENLNYTAYFEYLTRNGLSQEALIINAEQP